MDTPLAQTVGTILAERWRRGHRTIDSKFVKEQLAATGQLIPLSELEALLDRWEAQQWVQTARVHLHGSAGRQRAKTVVWISKALLV